MAERHTMSGGLNALMTPTLPGITTPPVTNTLAPPTLPGTAAAMAAPTTGATGAPGQPGQAQQPAFTPQQLYALQAMWQQQQAAQAQAAQAQAIVNANMPPPRDPSGNEGGAGGSADHGGADSSVM